MALYIFQFGFLQPIASIVNSQWPIATFSLGLIFLMLLNNGFRIKKYVIVAFVILSIYFLLNSLIYANKMLIILGVYFGFIIKSFSAFIIASLDVAQKELYSAFLKVAIFNFIAILFYPFVDFFDSMNYMRFGYAMLPSVIMFFYASLDSKFKNPLWVILTTISLALTIIYGSRGPIVVLLIFLFLLLIFSKRITLPKKVIFTIFSGTIIFLSIKFQLLIRVLDYIYYDIGLRTYALTKLTIMVTNGLAASSSGRDVLYSYIIDLIKNNPIIGYGVGIVQVNLGSTAHNIFLQIFVESGFVGFLIWTLIWIFCIKKYIKIIRLNNIESYKIITLLISISLGRLLISSDMWLRPEYWFVLSLLIGSSYNNIKNSKNVES